MPHPEHAEVDIESVREMIRVMMKEKAWVATPQTTATEREIIARSISGTNVGGTVGEAMEHTPKQKHRGRLGLG